MPTSLDLYAPFDSGAGSNVTEATWRDFMRHMLGSASGVIRGFLNEFAVIGDNSGMNVKVDTGECWMRGHYGKSTVQKTLSIAAAHATLPRKDRVILRADFTNNRVEVDVLTGTAAASPITPAVTQSTTIWETSLAIVDVPAADTAIAASQVTDNRVYTTAQVKWKRTATQSIASSNFARILFDTSVSLSGDVQYDPATGIFTLLRPGLWSVVLSVGYSPSASGKREALLSDPADVSGSSSFNTLANQTGPAINIGAGSTLQTNMIERFPANKQIAGYGYQDTGAALNVTGQMSIVWVGP